MIVCFFDIGGIIDHHYCLNFLFIVLLLKQSGNKFYLQLYLHIFLFLDEGNEEDMLKQAIAMSMEGHGWHNLNPIKLSLIKTTVVPCIKENHVRRSGNAA